MRLDLLSRLMAERAARRPAILVTQLATGAQRLVTPETLAADPLSADLRKALRTGKSGAVGEDADRAFLTVEVPPPRLAVIGAVHISQALAPLARVAGYDMVIIDPRTAFATAERFPDVRVIAEWPDQALPEVGLDPFTALIALTHDPKIDEPALEAGLNAGCFYVGALGSRRTHAKRLERLSARGLGSAALDRIHAPIGLDIGAVSPGEIAVAILAEVIGALRKDGPAMVRPEAAA
ncbi:XdhC family protein [Aquabacter spiritensis]|uniref:Putative sulfurylase large subunit (Molybdopterin cytosine dinucleotide biosynthesis) n=1 Tax=Aquabacter spiritensis TaxID=933073 RepID=A0A4V2UXT0_9HYPH|nr:XdhC family protein [Aquabacter spiritensis]TCT04648.1 putative sulfurylase large subunit (molybdopterin cytosine dinucleotide biosynthesis) [Aquabacter spiritensis]